MVKIHSFLLQKRDSNNGHIKEQSKLKDAEVGRDKEGERKNKPNSELLHESEGKKCLAC